MTESIVAGALLALMTGYLPGPFTTMVASTGLHRGVAAGARLSLVTLVTDLPPMFFTAFVVARLDEGLLRWVGFLGGAVVFYLAARVFRRAGEPLPDRPRVLEELHDLFAVAASGLLSPAPWLFWLVVGSPMLVRSLALGWWEAVAFAGAFFAVLIATQISVAWAASYGGRLAGDRWRRRALRTVSVVLLLGGGLILWTSYQGSFAGVVKRQQSLRSVVEETIEVIPSFLGDPVEAQG